MSKVLDNLNEVSVPHGGPLLVHTGLEGINIGVRSGAGPLGHMHAQMVI